MQTIYLDISNKGVIPTVYAKQNDVGRKFAVILTDSGLPYIPSVGSVFSVWYKGASGEGNYTDIGDKSAFSLNGNKVEVEMIVQMLSAHGDGILCLTLNSPDGNQISSWNIPYMCEIVPGSESEKAEEYYTAFSESVEKLKQVTENLTPEAIGAAPAGYGLGTASGKSVDFSKLDTAKAFGMWSLWNGGTINNIWFNFAKLLVLPLDANTVTQMLFPVGLPGCVLTRDCLSGTWGKWKCNNPPMIAGVEYRTNEQWNGKDVLTMMVETGTLVTGHNVITFSDVWPDEVVGRRISIGGAYNTPAIYSTLTSEHSAYECLTKGLAAIDINLFVGSAHAGKTAKVQVWYTRD